MRIVVGISGASGSLLAAKTIEALLDHKVGVSLIASNPARMVWQHEMNISYGESIEEWSGNNKFEHFVKHPKNNTRIAKTIRMP